MNAWISHVNLTCFVVVSRSAFSGETKLEKRIWAVSWLPANQNMHLEIEIEVNNIM
jgi:hypothetical protein